MKILNSDDTGNFILLYITNHCYGCCCYSYIVCKLLCVKVTEIKLDESPMLHIGHFWLVLMFYNFLSNTSFLQVCNSRSAP